MVNTWDKLSRQLIALEAAYIIIPKAILAL
jgi:hypothetical protein